MKFLNKLKNIYEYMYLMGIEWFVFRVKYEVLKKSNYFDKVNETILRKIDNCSEERFRYDRCKLISSDLQGCNSFIEKANQAAKGNIFSFSHEYIDYSENGMIEWQMNPISKIKADSTLSWNKLRDFGDYGDIKLIWEASRFTQVYYFVNAYSVTKDENYATACISQIMNWIATNPYPKGLNYKCGQEISFRIFAWIVALEYFQDFISKDEEEIIVKNMYISLLRIDANINYAAKSVKNNHSISEAAGLFVGGLLFPQLKESKYLIDKGLKYLIHETSYQVYSDGSYIQHSFIYQRLAIDVLSFVMLVAERKEFEIPKILKERQMKMVELLNSFMQGDGWLPNYGSNDGANLFSVTNADYRDFRTSLDFACGKSEFFNINQASKISLDKQVEFREGGYYILKNNNIFSFIRCHSYKDRPAQNDMFHFDVWYKGKNIFCDAGSYSYNTDKKFKDNFIGVRGHNTIMINDTNQMKKVLNFGYANWTKAKKVIFDKSYFSAENYAYKKEFGIVQERRINVKDDKIVVVDKLLNVSSLTNIKQIWNTKSKVEKLDAYSVKVGDCVIQSNIEYRLEENYISDYYNAYTIGTRIIFEVNIDKGFTIETLMEFDK